MITAVTHITLLVKDQQKALDFYVNVLGFEIHTDAMFGQERWLTICPPTQPNLEIAIMKASEIEAPLIGHQAGGKPAFGEPALGKPAFGEPAFGKPPFTEPFCRAVR